MKRMAAATSSERTAGEARQEAEKPRQLCGDEWLLCLCHWKIYICATEWQRLCPAVLSAWLCWCFSTAGTFAIPLNTTHRHQKACGKPPGDRAVWEEQRGLAAATILPRCCAEPKGISHPVDRWSPNARTSSSIPFPPRCVKMFSQV